MSYVTYTNRGQKTVYYTADDWGITEYENYPVACITHRHGDSKGHKYVTPPGRFNKSGFQCFGCDLKAPEDVITVWVLLNWDRLEWSEIQ